MANLSVALVIFVFLFAFVEAEEEFIVEKSSWCFTNQDSQICADDSKYDFNAIVQNIVDKSEKLGRQGKKLGKNSGVCANALKKVMCSKPSPLCFDGNDNSGLRSTCGELRRNCPLLAGESSDEYEDPCVSYLKRYSVNLTCVGIEEDKKFKGYCPKPSKKMPASYWDAYKRKSDILEDPMGSLTRIGKAVGVDLFSNDCRKKIEDAVCIPLYCTEDEKSIIVPNSQDTCNAVLAECINKAIDKYEKLRTVLEPVKKELTGGCDKVVNAVKASARAKNDAAIMSHTQSLGPELLLVTITLLVTYFY